MNATWTDLSGATTGTLAIPDDQSFVGTQVRVVVTTIDPFGGVIAFEGQPVNVANVNDMPQVAVSIAGTLKQGQTLSVSNDLTDADGLGTIGYQWLADEVDIPGATSSTLMLTQAQVGKTISVVASYTDQQGTAESVTSEATSVVVNINDPASGDVSIIGQPRQGKSLSAVVSVNDIDGLPDGGFEYQYQWFAGESIIEGATSVTLPVTPDLVGAALSVRVSFSDLGGAIEVLTSNLTSTVVSAVLGGYVAAWNGAGRIHGVEVSLHDPVSSGEGPPVDAVVSDTAGEWLFEGLDFDQFAIEAERAPRVEDRQAITSADAMAAFKLALGRNPNPDPDGPGPGAPEPVSAYQRIAADINQDGVVTREDAQAILMLSQGSGASRWVFLQAGQTGSAVSEPNISTTGEMFAYSDLISEVPLTGILLGDVNGSWAPV